MYEVNMGVSFRSSETRAMNASSGVHRATSRMRAFRNAARAAARAASLASSAPGYHPVPTIPRGGFASSSKAAPRRARDNHGFDPHCVGAGGSRSRIPYVHRSCRRLSPDVTTTSQTLMPTKAGIETLLRREVCEPRFWAAIYSRSEGAKSAHFDSGKLSRAIHLFQSNRSQREF